MDFLERYYKEEFFGDFNKLEKDLAKIPSESMRETILRSLDENELSTILKEIHPEVVDKINLNVLRRGRSLKYIKNTLCFISLLLKTPPELTKLAVDGSRLYAVRIARTLRHLNERTAESDRLRELYLELVTTNIYCPGVFGEEHCHMDCGDCWGRVIDRHIAPYVQLEGEWGDFEIPEPEDSAKDGSLVVKPMYEAVAYKPYIPINPGQGGRGGQGGYDGYHYAYNGAGHIVHRMGDWDNFAKIIIEANLQGKKPDEDKDEEEPDEEPNEEEH